MDYRLYFLDATGHVCKALELRCRNDAAALAEARDQANPHGLELWQGARKVAQWDAGADLDRARAAPSAPGAVDRSHGAI